MSWLDFNFWFLGPLPIWVLAVAVFVNAFVIWKVMNKFVPIIPVLENIIPELDKIIDALRHDTVSLNMATNELDSKLDKMRVAIESWHDSLRKIFWFIPLGGNNK